MSGIVQHGTAATSGLLLRTPSGERIVFVPGTLFRHFEILSFLGSGGSGQVYRARDTRDGTLCALKVMHLEYVGDASRTRRAR